MIKTEYKNQKMELRITTKNKMNNFRTVSCKTYEKHLKITTLPKIKWLETAKNKAEYTF